LKKLKKFTINFFAGANLTVVALMLLTGYSDHIDPVAYSTLSCLGMTFPFFLLGNLLFLFFWLTFKWRKVWIPIIGFALAYVPINIYFPLNFHNEVSPDALKVITYNVCDYGGNYKYKNGFNMVLDYLHEQNADIICTQEDVDTRRRQAFENYAKTYPHNDTTRLTGPKSSPNCVGIHTRFPIIRKERIDYESNCNGSVAYYLDLGKDTLLVINNHLESTHLTVKDRKNYATMIKGEMGRDTVRTESRALLNKLAMATAIRAKQADAVRDYIRRNSRYPVIVCGDFNDTPISYSRRTICEGLTDCFRASGRGVGLSYNQKGFFFRIDNIFCSKEFIPEKCIVDSEMDASDHYPMVCWLKMSDKP